MAALTEGNTHTCACCKGTFETDWSDEEAEDEAAELWGDLPHDARSVVCDDCFATLTRREVMTQMRVAVGMVLRHHSGRVYTVTAITNTAHSDPERVPEAVLLGANGNWWSRPLSSFAGKFTVLYDGTNLADGAGSIDQPEASLLGPDHDDAYHRAIAGM